MNKILKYLSKLSDSEREAIEALMRQLISDYTLVPGKRLIREKPGWYKVRIGNRRIIFRVIDKRNNTVLIERVCNRDDRTYKNL